MKLKHPLFNINNQGGPIIDSMSLLACYDDCILAYIGLSTKRAEIQGFGRDENDCPIIYIGANKATLHLKEGLEDKETTICFPQLNGWEIFSAEISRYSMSIAFIKPPPFTSSLPIDKP